MKILVELDGILRGTNDEPIPNGIILAGTLSVYNKITFFTELSQAEAEQWLNVNKVVDYDELLTAELDLHGEELKQRQLTLARSKGTIDLVITSDPRLWAYSFEQGFTSVLFGVPAYTRVEFRPDAPRKVRAWNEIEEAIKTQNELRTKDVRQTRLEGLMFE
jgi:hypothetical protein